MLAFDSVASSGQLEDCDEAGRSFLVSRGDGSPLLGLGPEPLDPVAVEIDPVRACDGRIAASGGDGWPCVHVPNGLPEGVAGVSAIRDDPFGRGGQSFEQRLGVGQLMSLALVKAESERSPRRIGDHASFGPISATRAAKRFTTVALRS